MRKVTVRVTNAPFEVDTDSVMIVSGAVETSEPRLSVVVMNVREVRVDSDAEAELEEGWTTTVDVLVGVSLSRGIGHWALSYLIR